MGSRKLSQVLAKLTFTYQSLTYAWKSMALIISTEGLTTDCTTLTTP